MREKIAIKVFNDLRSQAREVLVYKAVGGSPYFLDLKAVGTTPLHWCGLTMGPGSLHRAIAHEGPLSQYKVEAPIRA